MTSVVPALGVILNLKMKYDRNPVLADGLKTAIGCLKYRGLVPGRGGKDCIFTKIENRVVGRAL